MQSRGVLDVPELNVQFSSPPLRLVQVLTDSIQETPFGITSISLVVVVPSKSVFEQLDLPP